MPHHHQEHRVVAAGVRAALGLHQPLDRGFEPGLIYDVVYRARDSRLGREVAIKVLPAEVSSDKDHLSRFEKEAIAALMGECEAALSRR